MNPRTRRVAAVVRLRPRGRLGSFLTATRSAIWVGGGDRSFRDIFVISPRSNRVTHTIHPGAASVADLVADDDSVWASGAQAVLRLDPSGRVNVRLNVEGFVLATGVGSSVVWAAQPFVGEPMPTVNGRLLEVASTGATSQHQVRGLPVALIGSRDGVWTVEQQPNRLRLLC